MKRQPSDTGKCRYCGNQHHTSKEVVCDTITEQPLPFKISAADIPFVTINTEPLKLTTQNQQL